MIDTLKIYTSINKELYDSIYNLSTIKVAYSNKTQLKYYEIVNDHLEGSYSSSLSVRVGCGLKYHFAEDEYYIEIEGSYHKISLGYNSHDGFYNLEEICQDLIELTENAYNIKLPGIKNWYLQRADVAITFDLVSNENVCEYINNLCQCRYPKRKMKFYKDETVYCTGTSTTLKIYNKKTEFLKHDIKRFKDTSFHLGNYLKKIDGFIRFECEIKKKKLRNMFHNREHIPIIFVDYLFLRDIWSDEFMKLLVLGKKDLKVVRGRDDVYKLLEMVYTKTKARNLYNFYLGIIAEGIEATKIKCSKPTFYRNMKVLKDLNIDLTQKYDLDLIDKSINFNPFDYEEVV